LKSIWKYALKITDCQNVLMPCGATILSVGEQAENLCLWALVDPEREKCTTLILIYGTGHPFPEDEESRSRFIGTVQVGPLVWHIFEGLAAPF
jgi:hypothetical protein